MNDDPELAEAERRALSALKVEHSPPSEAEARIVARRVNGRRHTFQDAAWTKLRSERRVLWIVRMFRLIFGIQVIEIAEELVEAVHSGQEFVAVAEMVLAELAGRIALRLQKFSDRRVLSRQSFLRPGQANL